MVMNPATRHTNHLPTLLQDKLEIFSFLSRWSEVRIKWWCVCKLVVVVVVVSKFRSKWLRGCVTFGAKMWRVWNEWLGNLNNNQIEILSFIYSVGIRGLTVVQFAGHMLKHTQILSALASAGQLCQRRRRYVVMHRGSSWFINARFETF